MNVSAHGIEALTRLLEYTDVRTILDIGSGLGIQAQMMRNAGREVVTNALTPPATIIGNYLDIGFSEPFDAIWACHVLEHQPNPGAFLRKCFDDLRLGGVLAVTVPPLKHEIVGGHLSLWNTGLLLYHLILAGFDCREARVSGCYAASPEKPVYNLSVVARKVPAKLPALAFDNGDIERLAEFFPLRVTQGFDGRLPPINW